MKECNILGVKHTLTPPTYFHGGQDPNPTIYAPGSDVKSCGSVLPRGIVDTNFFPVVKTKTKAVLISLPVSAIDIV